MVSGVVTATIGKRRAGTLVRGRRSVPGRSPSCRMVERLDGGRDGKSENPAGKVARLRASRLRSVVG
ncbi:hypothetical protein SAMN05216275_101462 [Streptosporangium canum]|uniref:Uncharacterized protein n=1 Tax=Streptosporangium canum TaxID=324952 RepID=A0A1I3G061_9ACTN|nr:hypothetical protein SAMN05216275_101462 [Streptosporangium canum]